MSLCRDLVQRRCRWGALILAGVLAAAALPHTAEARHRHHHHIHHSSYDPPYASIVVDVNSGKVLEATNAESPRHPASLTKMMTLYLLFERLEAGKIKMSTELPVSEHASEQAPSKLGLKPGHSIEVGDAIRAIVTKSANDVAVTVAEALGGSEPAFAKLMNAKAHELGMMHTFYHNASGLPDDLQITTAHDMAILGRALQDRFPNYFHYFSTRYFTYRGDRMRNHDHLLGRVDGVDGIKTGYIHDSGFNIVTDVRRGDRHIIVVVFGGRTAAVRDARDIRLIADYIGAASRKRTAPLVVEGWQNAVVRADTAKHKEQQMASAPLPPSSPPKVGSTAPIKPNPVRTFVVQPGAQYATELPPLPPANRKLRLEPASAHPATITTLVTVRRDPPPLSKSAVAPAAKIASADAGVPLPVMAPEPAAKSHGGWIIQVGAFDVEKDAKERLTLALHKAQAQLDKAAPFTEPVTKGDKMLYRARFAGLEKSQAETACRHLKHSDIPCMMLKN